MSLDYAILGFLNYKPFSGYDLKKILDVSVRHFWNADQSQIYRTLARLSESGLTEIELVEQSDRPDRKVYHITPKGRETLRAWLGGPVPQEPHSAPLIQVFFSGQLSDEEILAKFQVVTTMFRMILAGYDQVPGQIENFTREIGSPRESYFWMLTLDLGIRTMRAQIEWGEEVIRALESKQIPPA